MILPESRNSINIALTLKLRVSMNVGHHAVMISWISILGLSCRIPDGFGLVPMLDDYKPSADTAEPRKIKENRSKARKELFENF